MTTAAAEDRERVGPYQVVQAIGAGGSARIDLARIDRAYGFQRHVVIKRPLEHLRGNAQVAASLRREARIGGLLRHPNLVAILDAGIHDGYDYLVLEYVHGSSLRALMQTDTPGEVRELPIAVALAIATDVARAMHEAHELTDETGAPLGLVHRDVSPGNILLGLDGTVKLADFGIAKETRVSTLSGSMHGTVTYMAPEQCQGHAFDRRADVFSLGVILYELVTGVRLFWADNDVASLHRVLSGSVPRPRKVKPQLPSALEDIVMIAVAHETDQRYPSALELATALELYAAGAGEILGARWIARTMEDVVGTRPVPWIAGPTLQDIALPTIPETAAPTIPDIAPRDDGSLVALISAVPPDEQVEPFGPDDDVVPASAEPAPPQRRSPVAAAEPAPPPSRAAPSPSRAAPATAAPPPSRAAPPPSRTASATAAPSPRRARTLMAAVVALGLVGGSALTALVMTRGSTAPATTIAPRSNAAEPPALAPASTQGSAPANRPTPASGSSPANGSAPAADLAPATGTAPAVDVAAPGPAPATEPAAANAASDRREAAPGTQPAAGAGPSRVAPASSAPSLAPGPAAVPSPTGVRNKRRKPAVRAAPRDPDPKASERAPSAAPAATAPPAPAATDAPSAGSPSQPPATPPPAATPPAIPPAKVEWKPTMLLPTDGSGARAPK